MNLLETEDVVRYHPWYARFKVQYFTIYRAECKLFGVLSMLYESKGLLYIGRYDR